MNSPQENTSSEGDASAPRRVLVVDDNTDAAASMSMLLELLGHQVKEVHDGLQAVAVVPEFKPDFIFMDIGMPNLDGIEATRRIRAMSIPHQPVIVALTGWGQQSDRERSQQAGINHHLVKPISLEAIRDLMVSHTVS